MFKVRYKYYFEFDALRQPADRLYINNIQECNLQSKAALGGFEHIFLALHHFSYNGKDILL